MHPSLIPKGLICYNCALCLLVNFSLFCNSPNCVVLALICHTSQYHDVWRQHVSSTSYSTCDDVTLRHESCNDLRIRVYRSGCWWVWVCEKKLFSASIVRLSPVSLDARTSSSASLDPPFQPPSNKTLHQFKRRLKVIKSVNFCWNEEAFFTIQWELWNL